MAKLYFTYGAMGSGKSTAALQVAHNYHSKGMKALLLKPSRDTKQGDQVSSRIGKAQKVDFLVHPTDDLAQFLLDEEGNPVQQARALIVDEAQFLTKAQVETLYILTKRVNLPVLCYGLRSDFQMQGYEGAIRLLEIADEIKEIKTICSCGAKATVHLRYLDQQPKFEGEQIMIDTDEHLRYVSVCGACYLKTKAQYHPSSALYI